MIFWPYDHADYESFCLTLEEGLVSARCLFMNIYFQELCATRNIESLCSMNLCEFLAERLRLSSVYGSLVARSDYIISFHQGRISNDFSLLLIVLDLGYIKMQNTRMCPLKLWIASLPVSLLVHFIPYLIVSPTKVTTSLNSICL